jgi:hypothetical protein
MMPPRIEPKTTINLLIYQQLFDLESGHGGGNRQTTGTKIMEFTADTSSIPNILLLSSIMP